MDPKTGVGETDTFGARSKSHTITVKLGDTYAEMRDKMLESLAKFQRNGSGWRLKEIIGLNIDVAKFNPLDGSGYSDLPACLKKKKAIINIQSKECDEECGRCKQCEESKMCFKSLLQIFKALNPVDDNPQRLTKELTEQAKEFNWEGITFPTKVKDISISETNNNININLFGYDDDSKKIYTIKVGELKNPLKTINLFLHDDNHYCVVKDLSRLVSSQISKNEHAKHICLKCLRRGSVREP